MSQSERVRLVERAWQSSDEIKYAALSPPPKGVVGGCRLATNHDPVWRIHFECTVVYSSMLGNVIGTWRNANNVHNAQLLVSAAPSHDVIDILSSDDEECAPPPPKK